MYELLPRNSIKFGVKFNKSCLRNLNFYNARQCHLRHQRAPRMCRLPSNPKMRFLRTPFRKKMKFCPESFHDLTDLRFVFKFHGNGPPEIE